MPVERITIPHGAIVLAPVSEAWGMEEWLDPSDICSLEGISLPVRRAEGVVWRALVRMEGIKGDITYADSGEPVVIPGGPWSYIGVSHSSALAVVIFSNERCAVDTEPVTRNFGRAASRFISSAEATAPSSDHPLFKAAMWCAKETLYKLSGRKELDLIGDILVKGMDFTKGEITGSILTPEGAWQDHPLKMLVWRGNMIVYA